MMYHNEPSTSHGLTQLIGISTLKARPLAAPLHGCVNRGLSGWVARAGLAASPPRFLLWPALNPSRGMGQAWLCGAPRPQHGAGLRRPGSGPSREPVYRTRGGGAFGHVAVFTSVGARRPRPRSPLVGPVSRGTRPHCVRARDAQAHGRREGRGEAKRVLGSSASTPCPRSGGSVCSPLLAP